MANSDEEDDSMFRLEGTTGKQKGGLVIMKKSTAADDIQHEFKEPVSKKSLLGLDRLAAIKRAENEQVQDKSIQDKTKSVDRHNER